MKILISTLIMAVSVPVLASADLAQKKGCMACHAVDRKVLGPAFRDVATKYAGRDLAIMERSIREGGSGRWGPVPMPAQPQVTATEAQALARWISTVK
jgi:cytochrome c